MEAREPCLDCPDKVLDDYGYFCDVSCGKRTAWLNYMAGYKAGQDDILQTIPRNTSKLMGDAFSDGKTVGELEIDHVKSSSLFQLFQQGNKEGTIKEVNMTRKLRPKYYVTRLGDDGALIGSRMESTDPDSIDSPFVLMPRKDPAAFRAMICYALYCEPDLRAEIAEWLSKIAEADTAYGTQGARNAKEMRAREIRLGL